MSVVEQRLVGRTWYRIIRNRALTGQQFHVRISDQNGHILLYSEKYRDIRDARNIINRFIKQGDTT